VVSIWHRRFTAAGVQDMILTATKRRNMPKSQFAGPAHSFPIPDANHARLAISGATRSLHAGNIGPQLASAIKKRAKAKLADLKS
jgi:hypothetical protein